MTIGGTIQNMAQQFAGAAPSQGQVSAPSGPTPVAQAKQYGQSVAQPLVNGGGLSNPPMPVGYTAPRQTPGAPGVAGSVPPGINIGTAASTDMGAMLRQMLQGYGVGLGATRPGAGSGQVSTQIQNNVPALIQMLVSHMQAQNAIGQMQDPNAVSAWV